MRYVVDSLVAVDLRNLDQQHSRAQRFRISGLPERINHQVRIASGKEEQTPSPKFDSLKGGVSMSS